LEVLCSNAFHFEHRPEHRKAEIPSLNQAQGTGLVATGATWRAARKADVNVRTAHVPCDAMRRHVAMRHGATQDQNADCRQQHMALQMLVPTSDSPDDRRWATRRPLPEHEEKHEERSIVR
jgi:hypothetical protein